MDIMQNEHFEETLNNLLDYSNGKDLLNFLSGTIIMFSIYKRKWNAGKELNIKETVTNFINYLPLKILKNIRGIYGIEKAKVGNFGISFQMRYMVLLNEYIRKIMELDKIGYGEIIEYKK
jgi:hypothetical protein